MSEPENTPSGASNEASPVSSAVGAPPAVARPVEILHRSLAAELVAKGVVPGASLVDRSAEPFPSIEVQPASLPLVVRYLKEQGIVNFLDSITAIDRLKMPGGADDAARRFEILYQMMLLPQGTDIHLRVFLPADEPSVPTIDSVFGNANWLEREVYDLFGIQFTGSVDLRRILLPVGWEGYPLRKDYVQGETAVGFSTSRPSPIDEVKREFSALLAEGEA